MEKEVISIVLPVYNAAPFLRNCIESVLRQSLECWELILINDGSTDNSLDICRAFQKQDSRLLLIDQPNSGPSTARNNGILQSRGKFITFIDADDCLEDSYLEKLTEPFTKNTGIQLSCCGYFELSKYHKKGLALHDFQDLLSKEVIGKQDFFQNIFKGVTGVLWGKMFLLSIIKEHGISLNPTIKLSEDLLFVFEYATHIQKVGLVREHLYYYNRLNENTLSGTLNISNLKDIQLGAAHLNKLGEGCEMKNFKTSLEIRHVQSILKISKDVALGCKPLREKIKDLELISYEFSKKKQPKKRLGMKDKVNMALLDKKKFLTLIIFHKAVCFLRYLKWSL